MNVTRVYRLLKLITVLQAGKRYGAEALAAELRVSRRTLYRDISLLQGVGIPCRFERETDTYAIPDSVFLPPVQLDLREALSLLLVTRKFLARQVHPLYQAAVDAALKVESTLPSAVLKHCGGWLEGISFRWPPTSSAETITDVFQALQRSVAERSRINIQYESVSEGCVIEPLLDPLRLVFIPPGWYLIAKSHLHAQVRTFKVDRVLNVVFTGDRFEPDPDFSIENHFGAAWRMIPEGRVYKIKLRFSADVAASVEEVHWHASQATTRLGDGGLIFEAEVDGLHEISAWIMGYGHHVEVLAPKALRDLVRERAERIVAQALALDRQGVE